jgi:hypothetical protein
MMGKKTEKPVTKSKPKGQQQTQNLEKQNTETYDAIVFPEMPEWDGDRFKGIGIKRMRGYKCDIPINELNSLREAFWGILII